MDHPLFLLQPAVADHQSRREQAAAATFLNRGEDHQVGGPGLVLQGDEYDLASRARPLAAQHDAGDGDARAGGQFLQVAGRAHPPAGQPLPQQGSGMLLEGQSGGPVVGHHLLARGHGGQGRLEAGRGAPVGRIEER